MALKDSKTPPISWIRKCNVVKIIIMPKAVCRFSGLTLKHATPFFTERKIIIQKFI